MENTFACSYFATFFTIYIHHVCNMFLSMEFAVDSMFCTDDLLKWWQISATQVVKTRSLVLCI